MTLTGTESDVSDGLRSRAAPVVDELAERLADPERVVAAATAEGNADFVPGMPAPAPPWNALGLAEAHPRVALLFAELSCRRVEFRSAADAHLARAADGLGAGPQSCGLFGGAASLAFAVRVSQRSAGDYAGLLAALDAKVAERLGALLAAERQRLDADRAGVALSAPACGRLRTGRASWTERRASPSH
ncbi:hypothetical protein [Saccharothrix sp. ST-888]|uniref:hypothetical protein n=1 Tax=Saccharothrix sp. ST-888 TaxID=1427391 RepID=UPI00069860BD|nr:hypothetical protein [Saccharothrix sp. ST-888]